MIPYILYALVVIFLSYKGEKNHISRLLLFFVAVLFMGLRLGVGKDYDNYKDYYDFESYIFEPGYNYLCLFAHQHHLGVQFVFFVMALLTYFFIYLFLERIKEFEIKYAPAAIMLYFLTFSIVCNVMRECLAASIFLYSCYYIKDNKLLHYLALIAFATPLFYFNMHPFVLDIEKENCNYILCDNIYCLFFTLLYSDGTISFIFYTFF